MARDRRFAELDGLRALAMTGVFLFHAGFFATGLLAIGTIGAAPTTWGARIVPNLNVGVEVFFVLSGFLIYRPYALARAAGRPAPELARYLARRALRIYPAYWLALAVLLVAGATYVNGFGNGVKHFALLHTYFGDYGRDNAGEPGLDVSWTLVIEMSFYAFVPFAAWLARRVAVPVEVCALVAVTLVGHALRIWMVDHALWAPLRVLPPALAAFAPGMLLAVVSAHAARAPAWVARAAARAGWWWCGAALVFLLMTRYSYGTPVYPLLVLAPRMKIWHDTLAPTVAVLLVAPFVLDGARRHALGRFLSARPVAWIGVVSYGTYLWHHAIMLEYVDVDAVRRMDTAGEGVYVAGLYLVVLAVGAASWYLVERPGLALTDRVRSRRPAVRAGTG